MSRENLIYDNLEQPDTRTLSERGIYFKSVDGQEHPSIAVAKQANKAYWDRVKYDTSRRELKAYTEDEIEYYDVPKVDINDKNAGRQALADLSEKKFANIEKEYGSSLEELLEQFGYGQQDINKKTRR